ncbi:MAG: type II methionyl aminopeptidase [Candidatus Nezhaarchaeales archaeon]
MEDYAVSRYLEAGRIATTVLKRVSGYVYEGVPVIELCERVERMIREHGAQPAFPCNVSINHVAAHYSSPAGDSLVIPKGSVVKVDVGVHVEGYIGDAAITISLNPAYHSLVTAAEKALKNAIALIKRGVTTKVLGRAIEQTIKQYGYKPVENLCGHKMAYYSLHEGVSVPNVEPLVGHQLKAGEVYAIEPFATDGAGVVKDSDKAFIYRYVAKKGIRGEIEKRLIDLVWDKYRTLPFSERWFTSFQLQELRSALSSLVSKGSLHAYPVLVEKAGGMVSQSECTVIVTEDGCIVTAGIEGYE